MKERDPNRLTNILEDDGWRTEQTYSKNFTQVPTSSGVYLVIAYEPGDLCARGEASVLYAGMSTNLAKRKSGHAVISEIDATGRYPFFYFKEYPREEIRIIERNLIQKYNPPYNIIGKRRGL